MFCFPFFLFYCTEIKSQRNVEQEPADKLKLKRRAMVVEF